MVRRCFQHPLAALQLLNLLTAPLVVDLKPSDDAILLWIGGTGFRGRQIADFGEEAVKEAHVVARENHMWRFGSFSNRGVTSSSVDIGL